MTDKSLSIAIVNTLLVPSGAASVNRLLSYAKAMVDNGDDVTVLSSAYSTKPEGILQGVKYRNLGDVRFHSLSLIVALLRIVWIILKYRFDAIILVSNSVLLIYPIVFFCKIKGINIIQEKSEFPFVLMKKGFFNRLWAAYYTSTTYKLFDGLIVMTKPLMDYFKPRVRKDCKMIVVPMTVDLERFKIEKKQFPEYGKYIAYCGDMAGNKDGVDNLIKSFSVASKTIKDIKLLLIGDSSNKEEFRRLKDLAENECPENIIFYGRAPREIVPQLLKDASALALARPSSLQSSGGFPTKLGEYLATGNPVVVTAVGDIPYYLNSDNSFIVEPDNNQLFADKIISIFQDYNHAKIIGQEGRKVAQTIFNSQVQAPRIHHFIEQICV